MQTGRLPNQIEHCQRRSWFDMQIGEHDEAGGTPLVPASGIGGERNDIVGE